MSDIEKSKEELIQELQVLRKENEKLKMQKNIFDFNNHAQMTFEFAGVGILGIDANGNHTFVNQHAANLLGYKIEELIGKNSHATWHYSRPDGQVFPSEECPIYFTLNNGVKNEGESYVWRKDGSGFFVDFTSLPIFDNNIVIGVIVTFFDISNRKLTEEEKYQSSKKWEAIVNASPDGIGMVSLDGKIQFLSDKLALMYGYSIEEKDKFIGHSVFEFIDPSNHEILIRNIHKLLNGEDDRKITEYIAIKNDKSKFYVELYSTILLDINGKPANILYVQRDITERKLAETKQKNQTSILSNIIINLQEAILLEDANRKIVLSNQLFCNMFNIPVPPELLKGADCTESAEQSKHLFKDPDKFINSINNILSNKKAVFNEELEFLDGRYFERDYIPTYIDNIYTGHLWKYRDITVRKRAEQILNARLRLNEFANTHSLMDLQQKLLDELEELTDSNIGFYHLVNDKQKTLTFQNWSTNASHNFNLEEFRGNKFDINQFEIWNDIFKLRKPVIHNKYLNLSQLKIFPAGHTPISRELVVPIFRNDQIVALVGIANKPVDYNENDIEAVSLLADMAWDITERKGSEEELKKLSQAVEQSPAIIFITNLKGAIEYANPKTIELTGYTFEQLLGQNPRIFKSGNISQDDYRKLWKTISSGMEWKGEFHNKKKTGELYWVKSSITPIFDTGDNISYFLAVQEDITEQKKAEDKIRLLNADLERRIELRTAQLAETNESLQKEIEERKRADEALNDSEKSYRTVIENVKEIIFQTDSNGLWIFLNKSWEEITGFSVEESLGQLFVNYVHPDDRQRNMDLFEPLINRKKEFCRHHVRYLTKSGGFRWIEVFARLGLNERNEATGTYGTLRDITEQMRAEEFENELLNLSVQLTGIPTSELDAAIDMALSQIGSFLLADRAYIFELDIIENTMSNTHEWCNIGIQPEINNLQKIPYEILPMWMASLERHDYISIPSVPDLPETWSAEREILEPQGIQSLLVIPILNENNLIGFVGLDSVVNKKEYDTSEINYLKVWSNMLASLMKNQKIELYLNQTRKNYETFFNTIDDFLFVLDTQGNIIHFNNTVSQRLGYSPEELIDNSVLMVHPSERRAEAGRIVGEMLAGTSDFCPVPLITKTGNYISVETRVKPGFWDGKPVIFGLSKDVSKIILSEEKFSKAFQSNSALMAISGFDDGIFIEVNDTFLKTLGYSREEIIGKSSIEINMFAKSETRYTVISRLKHNLPVRETEIDVKTKSGEILIGLFSADHIVIGNKLCLLTVMVDITERKQAEKEIKKARNEAEKANLAKSEFLSRMSHELRTPMNSILGFAQLMEMGELNPAHKKAVNHILNSGRHLLNLINEVLEISRIEAGKITLSLEPVKLKSVISEILDTIQPLALKHQLTIYIDNPTTDLLYVMSDSQRLKQVLLNLINNAIKYNKVGGKVIVRTEMLSKNDMSYIPVRISIIDNGLGISSEDIPKLFKPFERIGAEKTQIEGSGLGLSVVKKLIAAMGGIIGVNSTLGEGSTFWIELPMCESQQKQSQLFIESATQDMSLTDKHGTILYIEDNMSNFELVDQILKNHRSNIHLISSIFGKNAVQMAIEYAPNLILLDLDLPDIHGSQVLANLLENFKTKNIPVIIISADAMPKQMDKLLNSGAVDYLTKPLDITTFLKVIDKFFKINK